MINIVIFNLPWAFRSSCDPLKLDYSTRGTASLAISSVVIPVYHALQRLKIPYMVMWLLAQNKFVNNGYSFVSLSTLAMIFNLFIISV